MQYALFKLVDGLSLTPQNIGEQLEEELEKLAFRTLLPTAADWGYVFRLKTSGCSFDVSIVPITGQKFGLAIEMSKSLIDRFLDLFKANEIKAVKVWIDEILSSEIGVVRIKWYSDSTWRSTFKEDFWIYVNR